MDKKYLWYMVSTITGKEDQVVESLKNRIISEQVEESFDMDATEDGAFKIFKKPVLTPKEAAKKLNGEPYKIKWANMYSGYIFIHMDMTDRAWYVVRNTQYVTGLIGSSGKGAKPTPVPLLEIKKSFRQEQKIREDFETGRNETTFKVGEIVEINNGPFIGNEGKVIHVDEKNQRATVEIEYYGRKTPTDFEYKVIKSKENE